MIRGAIVELNNYHDELFPTWHYLFSRLGWEHRFITTPMNIRKNVLDQPGGASLWTPIKTDWNRERVSHPLYARYRRHRLRRELQKAWRNTDLVVLNSVEPAKYRFLSRLAKQRKILVIHEPRWWIGNAKYQAVLKQNDTCFVTLAPHISDYLAEYRIRSTSIRPVAPPCAESTSSVQKNRFCVQGKIELSRRNYGSLAEGIKKYRHTIRVDIVGKAHADGETVKKFLRFKGVDTCVHFNHEAFPYDAYYRAIRESHFLLVLVDDTQPVLLPYLQEKCSSSINTAVSLGIIPIVNEQVARIYDIADCSLTYPADDVAAGIEKALALQEGDFIALKNRVAEKRKGFLENSWNSFTRMIRELGFSIER